MSGKGSSRLALAVGMLLGLLAGWGLSASTWAGRSPAAVAPGESFEVDPEVYRAPASQSFPRPVVRPTPDNRA